MATPIGSDEYLSTEQVAQITGRSVSTIRYWRMRNVGPAGFRMGGKRIAYRRSEVEAWLVAQEAATTRGGVA